MKESNHQAAFPQLHSYEPLPKAANSPVTTRQWTEEEKAWILSLKPPTRKKEHDYTTLAPSKRIDNQRKKER
jgi:hypothetical protein